MQFSQTLHIFIKSNFKSFIDDESDGAEEPQRKAFNTPSLPRAPVFGASHSQSEMAMSQSQGWLYQAKDRFRMSVQIKTYQMTHRKIYPSL